MFAMVGSWEDSGPGRRPCLRPADLDLYSLCPYLRSDPHPLC